MTSETIADAVYVPGSLRRGNTMPERLRSVLAIAEPLLGVDRRAGERGYVRVLKFGDPRRPDVWLFVTKSTDDLLLFPKSPPGPLSGQPRYDWIDGPSGVKLGFLKTAARAVQVAAPRPPGT
jgi:hypothetical protein